MGKVRIVFGTVSNRRTYYVMRLVKRFSGYVYLPVRRVSGSDVTVAKYIVPSLVKNDEVFVVFSTFVSGKTCKYFYHPKYRCWYKDLDDVQIVKYFSWL